MARINNTDIYPVRQIAVGGMLLGTDSNGRTVNFIADTSIASLFVQIDGFQVLLEGKTDSENWEDNDKFEGWYNNVYYVGRIVDASDLTMPDDILDTDKVLLALNNPAI